MIYTSGHLKPLKSQVADALTRADDSFCTLAAAGFVDHLPTFNNMPRANDPIVLTLTVCEPHDDDFLGDFDDAPAIRDRRAIFWLLKGSGVYVQVANDSKRMDAGDFIVFNDAMTHSVIAKRKWYGAAWQLQYNKR